MGHGSELAAKFHALYETTVEILETYEKEKLNYGELRQKDVKGDLQDNAKVGIFSWWGLTIFIQTQDRVFVFLE